MPYKSDAALILLFGAGTGSQIWLERNAQPHQKYVILDNDETLWGTQRYGIEIRPPVATKELSYSRILVLLSHVTEVRNQLLSLGVPITAIIIPPKPAFRPQPFLSVTSRRNALVELRQTLHDGFSWGADVVVEQGTALGLYRSGDLIPWDNDIDLSVPWEARGFLESYASSIAETGTASDLILSEEPGGLIMTFVSLRTKVPYTIFTRRVEQGWAIAPDFHKVRPEDLRPSFSYTDHEGHQYPLPAHPQRYFETIYGTDWQTPRQRFSFADYPQIRARFSEKN